MGTKSYKIWGTKHRIYQNDKCEIDILYLQKNTFCSIHSHKTKSNQFHVIEGRIALETDYGKTVLGRKESSAVIVPGFLHRFRVLEDSVVIEIASVDGGRIDNNDIDRTLQGGKIMNGRDITETELKRRKKLNFGTIQLSKDFAKAKEKKNCKKTS